MKTTGMTNRKQSPASSHRRTPIQQSRAGVTVFFLRAIVRHLPPRHRLNDLLRHAYYQGQYSIKVNPRYAADTDLPWPWRTRLGLAAGAPVLAAGGTLRLFWAPAARRYWYTMPAIWLAKLAWCLGAARHA